MKSRIIAIIPILYFILSTFITSGQEKTEYKVACIAFYNIENLFDTINQENVIDEEFLPDGLNAWNSNKYWEKEKNIAEVISQIGTDMTPDGPAILGLSEIENRSVLEDLVNEPSIKNRNYQIVHIDGPDRRGVDCALLYNPRYFRVTNVQSRAYTLPEDTSFHTRDQLVVSGLFDGELMHFVVNHWPSRSGGQKRSEHKRIGAAQKTRSIVDSLLKIDPMAKIVVMGDLNDDPVDKSVKEYLNTGGEIEDLKPGQLYNPMLKMYKNGIGSLAYRDSWNLFDQVILSQALLGDDKTTFKYYKAQIFNKPFLLQKDGAFKGYPWRTFAGGVYLGGYSDHFPAMVFLLKKL